MCVATIGLHCSRHKGIDLTQAVKQGHSDKGAEKLSKQSIQTPRIPKHLETGELYALDSQADVYGLMLTGSDVAGQSAQGLVFEEVKLKRVNFRETRLDRVRVMDAEIGGSDFSGAVWDHARLTRVAFNNCRLIGLQLVEAELHDIRFSECNLTGGLFVGVDSSHLAFDGCVLQEASFQSAKLKGVSFKDCDLTGVDFLGAELKGADFRGANISGVRVGADELEGAIIDPSQAVQIVALLGVEVRDPGEALET
jgi:uncharacterized protein YjbI with pentapeptide repeats